MANKLEAEPEEHPSYEPPCIEESATFESLSLACSFQVEGCVNNPPEFAQGASS